MGEEGFKHIAVNAADDDDFVIRVGVSDVNQAAEPLGDAKDAVTGPPESADDVAAAKAASVSKPVAATATAAETASVADAADDAAADEAEPARNAVDVEVEHVAESEGLDPAPEALAPEVALAAAATDARGKGEDAAGKAQRRPQKDDGYHETTLEDLKGEKMSLTQRVVIIAAIICIIGAIVYYFAFMR